MSDVFPLDADTSGILQVNDSKMQDSMLHEVIPVSPRASPSPASVPLTMKGFNEIVPAPLKAMHRIQTPETHHKSKFVSCMICGMTNLQPPYKMCKKCEIGVCSNCDMERRNSIEEQYKHYEGDPEHEMLPVENNLCSSNFLGSSTLFLRSRTSMVPTREDIKDLNDSVAFSTENFNFQVRRGSEYKARITVTNTNQRNLSFPEDTIVKCVMGQYSEPLEVGALLPNNGRKTLPFTGLPPEPDQQQELHFRLYSRKMHYFGLFLFVIINCQEKPDDPSQLIVKISMKAREEKHIFGNLIKAYLAVNTRIFGRKVTVSGNVVSLEDNMSHDLVFDRVWTCQSQKADLFDQFNTLVEETVASISMDRSVVLFHENYSDSLDSPLLEQSYYSSHPNYVFHIAQSILSKSDQTRLEFGCFKLSHNKLFDIQDAGLEKKLLPKQTHKRFYVENLKLYTLTSLDLFEQYLAAIYENKRQEGRKYHWVFLFNVHDKKTKKQTKVSYLVVDLARRGNFNKNMSESEKEHWDSIDASYRSFTKMVVWLSSTLHDTASWRNSNNKGESYLTNLVEHHMMNDADLRYVFDATDVSSTDELKKVMSASNQLKMSKRQTQI